MTKGLDILHGITMVPLGKAWINGGGGGGGINKKRIIIKSDTIPEASSKTYKLIYIYSGESNGTYHHGYIYECVADVTYNAKNIYFDSHNMGFDYRNADPSKNFTTDGEAMEAFLELVLRNKDVSFLQVTNGALTRKETGMWNVQLKDKDGNILLDNYQLGPEDLEDFGFVFLQQQSAYVVGEPEDFDFVWEQTSISNYHWNRLDVQPGSSGGTTDYADLTNKPQINGVTLSGNKTADDLGLNAMATINFYDVNNWELDVTKTELTLIDITLGNSVFVFKNGVLIQGNSNDYSYTVSGNNSVITFTTALEDTDKIAVINGNLTGIDLTPYLTASDLVPYQQKVQIIEDSSATPGGNDGLAIQANKVYKFTNSNISQIKFASCEQSELVTKIDFTTGATAPQFSDGNSIDWADGETPHFYAYQHYWIIISNGVGFVKEIY